MKNEEFISPFNKAKFENMPLFNVTEMGKLFESYKLNANEDGVPSDLTGKIIKESCGHPASFMILLKLYDDFRPNVNLWEIKFQENFVKYMNGTHIKLKYEVIEMSSDEKRYLRDLIDKMADRWDMNLSDLTALDDIDKKLFNMGILNIMGTNVVGFTSCVIWRVCVDALFPTPSRSISRDEVPDNPADLLALGLGFIDPIIVSDARSKKSKKCVRKGYTSVTFLCLQWLIT